MNDSPNHVTHGADLRSYADLHTPWNQLVDASLLPISHAQRPIELSNYATILSVLICDMHIVLKGRAINSILFAVYRLRRGERSNVVLNDLLDLLLDLGSDLALRDLLEESAVGRGQVSAELSLPAGDLVNRDGVELENV